MPQPPVGCTCWRGESRRRAGAADPHPPLGSIPQPEAVRTCLAEATAFRPGAAVTHWPLGSMVQPDCGQIVCIQIRSWAARPAPGTEDAADGAPPGDGPAWARTGAPASPARKTDIRTRRRQGRIGSSFTAVRCCWRPKWGAVGPPWRRTAFLAAAPPHRTGRQDRSRSQRPARSSASNSTAGRRGRNRPRRLPPVQRRPEMDPRRRKPVRPTGRPDQQLERQTPRRDEERGAYGAPSTAVRLPGAGNGRGVGRQRLQCS